MSDEPRRVDRVPDDVDLSDLEHRYPVPHRFASLREKTETLPEDEWDGMCDLDFEMAPRTDDSEVDALVLFGDVDFTDPEAVEARRVEWIELGALEGGDD